MRTIVHVLDDLLKTPACQDELEALARGIGARTPRGQLLLEAQEAVASHRKQMNVVGSTDVSQLVFEAMVRHAKKHELESVFGFSVRDPDVDVQLLINGVPVPVEACLQNGWNALCEGIDTHILNRAKELISAAALDGLRQKLEQAEVDIEEALTKALETQKDGL